METYNTTAGPQHMPSGAIPIAVVMLVWSFLAIFGGVIVLYHLSQNEGRYTCKHNPHSPSN